MTQSKEQRTLIIGPSWVGDMVMSQSLYKLLKQHHPDYPIDVLAPRWSQALLQRMPEVSRSLEMPFGHGELSLLGRRRLALSLRGLYQRAIVLPNSWKSALVPYWAGIPRRTGFSGEARFGLINDMRELDRSVLVRTVDRYAALALDDKERQAMLEEIPHPRLRSDASVAAQLALKLNLELDKPILALMPGSAFGPSKRWPANYFADIADRYLQLGWRVWVLGSQSDYDDGERIVAAAGQGVHNLSGETSLDEVVDLISLTSLAVANDSGLMHVAAALDIPTVAIYGSTSPYFTPPLSQTATSAWQDIECSPCYQRTCPYGHYRCMTELSPSTIYAKAEGLRHRST